MKVARAIVEASLHYDDPEVLMRVSSGLGEPMKGIDLIGLPPEALLQGRESSPQGSPHRGTTEA
jgi:pyridoxal 5'-phosphate synthase pdxS subunit